MTYTSLHAHSIFSILDGHAKIDDYVAKVKSEGHTHVALTDHGTLAGLPSLWKAAAKNDLTPIAGMEAYMTCSPVEDRVDESFHLTLLAMNREGYDNLMALSSFAWEHGFYRRPRLDLEHMNQHSQGLVCLSGCLGAVIPKAIVAEEWRKAEILMADLDEIFEGRFFLELMDHGDYLPEQRVVNMALEGFAKKFNLRLVGTNDSHYCAASDWPAYQALTSIQGGTDRKAGSPYTWIRTNEEMLNSFGADVLKNTMQIAEMCERYDLGSPTPHLPRSPWETTRSPMGELDVRVERGLLARLGETSLDDVDMEYIARMDHEVRTIARVSNELGAPLERYFLNVGALAEMMHERKIRFSTRGSAAGSLVCWALGISNLDPIKDNLLFERFLNPYRVALPDIDIDVPDNRRDEILVWLKETYGEEHVARIGTYSRIGPKVALKDAARINANNLSREYQLVAAELAALVPHSTNPQDQSLASVLAEENSELRKAAASDPEVALVVETAKLIADRFRGRSTHAGGVVIADVPISKLTPTAQVLRAETAVINRQTQFEMEELEDGGLIKFDLLGLSELSKMEAAVQGIAAATGDTPDLENLDWNEREVWDLICSGDTLGLFQLAGRGMTRLIKRMQPRSLPELAQVIAMFRPGPMANLDEITARKNGDSPVTSLHPSLDAVLAPTYGFPIFQEQLIEIVVIAAGYAPGEADLIRKAIGKKDVKLMAEKGIEFKERAMANGYTEEEAEDIWAYIVPFAAYGFNKAHAAVYAAEAYKSAWLKAHYGEIFYAAAMSIEARSGGNGTPQERIGHLAQEAKRRGIQVLRPDVNRSLEDFTPEGAGVRFGLGAIKDVGTKGAQALVRNQPYTSLVDLVRRVPAANKKDLTALIEVGAMPTSWGTRGDQLHHLEQLLEIRKKKQVGKRKAESATEAKMRGEEKVALLFAEAGATPPPNVGDMPWLAQLRGELDRLGIIHSEFPTISGTTKISELGQCFGQHVRIAGVVVSLQPKLSRAGNRYSHISIIDDSGVIDGMIWPRAWENCKISEGDHVCASGVAKLDAVWESEDIPPPSALRLYVEHIGPVEPEEELKSDITAKLILSISDEIPSEALDVLGEILATPEGEEYFVIDYAGQQTTHRCTPLSLQLLSKRYERYVRTL